MVPRRSQEGSTALSPLRPSTGDPGAARGDLRGRAAALPHHPQGLAPTFLCFSLAFESGCGLPEEPALLCGRNAPPLSWGCRDRTQELKPCGFCPHHGFPDPSIHLPMRGSPGEAQAPGEPGCTELQPRGPTHSVLASFTPGRVPISSGSCRTHMINEKPFVLPVTFQWLLWVVCVSGVLRTLPVVLQPLCWTRRPFPTVIRP